MAWRKQSSTSSLAERYGQDWTSVGPEGVAITGGGAARACAPPDAGGGPVMQPAQQPAEQRTEAPSITKSPALQADRVVTPRKLKCAAPQPPPTNLADWTVAHVAEWVASTPLPPEVSDRLRENAINGPVLESLTDQDMVDMGIEKFGWRRQLFLSRQELFDLLDSDANSQKELTVFSPTDSDSVTEWHQIHSRSPTDKGSPEGPSDLRLSPGQRLVGQQLERQQLEHQMFLVASPTPPVPMPGGLQPGLVRRPAPPTMPSQPPLPPHERMPLAASARAAAAANTGAPSPVPRHVVGTASPCKGASISTQAFRGQCTPTHPSRTPIAGGGPRESTEPIAQQFVPGAATPLPPGAATPLPPGAIVTPQLSARGPARQMSGLPGMASPPAPVARQMSGFPGTASSPAPVARQKSGLVRLRSPSPPAPLPPPHLAAPPGSSKSSTSIRVQSPPPLAPSPASAKALNAGASPRVLVQSPSPRGLPAPAAAEELASARGSLGRRHAVPTSWGAQGSPHPGPASGGSMKVAMLPSQQGSPQTAPTSGGSMKVAMLPLQQGSPERAPTSGGSVNVAMLPPQPGAQPVVWRLDGGGNVPFEASVVAPSRPGGTFAVGATLLRQSDFR